MVQPINYLSMIPQVDIGEQFTKGLQTGNAFRQLQKQRESEDKAKIMEQQYAVDIEEAARNPSQATFANLILKYPQQREALGDVAKMYGQGRVDEEFYQGAEISNALESGNLDVAKQRLSTIIEARKNANQPAGIFQQVYDKLDKGDVSGAQATTNFSLSILDPEKFKKIAEAKTAVIKDPLEARKLEAEAKIKEAEAGFATEKALADIGKTQAEASKAQMEADQITKGATGVITDPKDRFRATQDLRKELTARLKNYNALNQTYGVIEASANDNTGAGDVALVTAFMKMLDPESVVRESEFATARDTSGLLARLQSVAKKVESGQFLSAEQRTNFAALAKKYKESSDKYAADVKRGFKPQIKTAGLSEEEVFGDYGLPKTRSYLPIVGKK